MKKPEFLLRRNTYFFRKIKPIKKLLIASMLAQMLKLALKALAFEKDQASAKAA